MGLDIDVLVLFVFLDLLNRGMVSEQVRRSHSEEALPTKATTFNSPLYYVVNQIRKTLSTIDKHKLPDCSF